MSAYRAYQVCCDGCEEDVVEEGRDNAFAGIRDLLGSDS